MSYIYSFKGTEKHAKALVLNAPVSVKHSREISNFIRNKKLSFAMDYLNEVIKKNKAIPFKRYNKDVAHKKTMAAGRYPVKACGYFLKVLHSAKQNAVTKGFEEDALFIDAIVSNFGSRVKKSGRVKGQRKLCHIEVHLTEKVIEKKVVKKADKPNKEAKVAEIKKDEKIVKTTEAKKEIKTEEVKVESSQSDSPKKLNKKE